MQQQQRRRGSLESGVPLNCAASKFSPSAHPWLPLSTDPHTRSDVVADFYSGLPRGADFSSTFMITMPLIENKFSETNHQCSTWSVSKHGGHSQTLIVHCTYINTPTKCLQTIYLYDVMLAFPVVPEDLIIDIKLSDVTASLVPLSLKVIQICICI